MAIHTRPALKVFEVDHPDTQDSKREWLRATGIGIPDAISFVPVNFEQSGSSHVLNVPAFDMNRAAFFSILGSDTVPDR
jgi:O-methyltransferase involved in polyketide biosynthesis